MGGTGPCEFCGCDIEWTTRPKTCCVSCMKKKKAARLKEKRATARLKKKRANKHPVGSGGQEETRCSGEGKTR